MAKIFKPSNQSSKRKHKSLAKQLPDFVGDVSGYDPEAKGIIRTSSGRIAFVPSVIIGETVKVRPRTYTEKIIKADVLDVLTPSEKRVSPACKHYELCGGCQLQHMHDEHQIEAKQSALNQLLMKQLGLTHVPWQPTISAEPWHYRRSARLSIWFNKDGSFELGFRQNKSKQIVNIDSCPILVQPLSELIIKMKPVIQQLENRTAITHIQMFAQNKQCNLIFRIVNSLTNQDTTILKDFAEQHKCLILLEHDKHKYQLVYSPTEQDGMQFEYQVGAIQYRFSPHNFVQVNAEVNHLMIQQALSWLQINKDDTVLDLFSGVGNFTLPIAKEAKQVFAVEGVVDMVKQLNNNAQLNGFDNISAHQADLSIIEEKYKPMWLKHIDKLLLDPARDGAFEVVKKIPLLNPKQILYVSCNPTTLVRDVKVLQDAGYTLKKMGLLNMFPQTSHVEAMALLERK